MASEISIDHHADPVVIARAKVDEQIEEAFKFFYRDELSLEDAREAIRMATRLEFEKEKVSHLMKMVDENKNGLVTKPKLINIFKNGYPASLLSRAFYNNADGGVLKPRKLPNALHDLGIFDFTELEAKNLSKRSLPGNHTTITLDMFVRLTSPACLYMHGLHSTLRETPADWNKIVGFLHSTFGVIGLAMVGYLPKPAVPHNLEVNQTLLFVAHPHKKLLHRAGDVFALLSLEGWALTYIVSLLMRGKSVGRVWDCISLSFACALLCIFVAYINTVLLVVLLITFPFLGFFLYKANQY